MTQFTKGPYKAENSSVIDGYGEILTVFVRGSIKGRNNEDYATARLLAAAPDMLEALEELILDISINHSISLENMIGGSTRMALNKAFRVIAKAKGESK